MKLFSRPEKPLILDTELTTNADWSEFDTDLVRYRISTGRLKYIQLLYQSAQVVAQSKQWELLILAVEHLEKVNKVTDRSIIDLVNEQTKRPLDYHLFLFAGPKIDEEAIRSEIQELWKTDALFAFLRGKSSLMVGPGNWDTDFIDVVMIPEVSQIYKAALQQLADKESIKLTS